MDEKSENVKNLELDGTTLGDAQARADQPDHEAEEVVVSASGGAAENAEAGEYLLNQPITGEMLAQHAAQKSGHDMSFYSSHDRYIGDAAVRKQQRYTKGVSAILIVFAILIVVAGAYIGIIFNTASNADAYIADSVDQQNWGASDKDIDKLATEGYDAISLTEDVRGFCENFFTFDKDSVEDGNWKKSFSQYVAASENLVPIQENLIYVREKDTWKDVFEVHPYFVSQIVSCNRISWYILPTDTVNVPYCDVYIEVDRCPLNRYDLNSPDFTINRYLDRYRIVFDASGKITSCKKMNATLLEEGVDESAMAADAAIYEKARADAERKAEEQRREAAAEAARIEADQKSAEEEARKAEEEAAKKAAEEEAKKKAEADAANKNANTNTAGSSAGNANTGSNTNTGGNSNGNAGSGNENTGGNTGGNTGNAGGDSGSVSSGGNASGHAARTIAPASAE